MASVPHCGVLNYVTEFWVVLCYAKERKNEREREVVREREVERGGDREKERNE